MTIIQTYTLDTDFSDVYQLQAQGTIDTGANLPNGIDSALYIQDGYMVSYITQDDDITASGIRSEITDQARAIGEYWYTWEFQIPTEFAAGNDPIILMQIHDTPDGGDPARAVPFYFSYEQPGYFGCFIPVTQPPSEGANSSLIAMSNIVRDVWYHGCLRVKWATDSTGFMEFYLNRRPLFKIINQSNMYSDTTGPYFKCGCYDSTHNANFGTAKAYYRNVNIYSGNDGYETVMGGLQVNEPKAFLL